MPIEHLKLGMGSSAGVLWAEWSCLSSGLSGEVFALYGVCDDVKVSLRFLGCNSMSLWELPGKIIGRVTGQWGFSPFFRYVLSLVVTFRFQ